MLGRSGHRETASPMPSNRLEYKRVVQVPDDDWRQTARGRLSPAKFSLPVTSEAIGKPHHWKHKTLLEKASYRPGP